MPGESQMDPSTGRADPSVLTTEALQREVEAVKNLVQIMRDGHEDITAERFRSVEQQFQLIEKQRVEQKNDTKAAVDAALAAAKEAVQEQTKAGSEAIGKSEALTRTQFEQLSTAFTTGLKAVSDIIQDLKDRVVRIETAAATITTGAETRRNDSSLMISFGALLVAVVGVAAAIVLATAK